MPMRLWVGTGFDRYAQELSLVSGALGQVDWYARFGMPAAGRRMSDVVTCWPAQLAGTAGRRRAQFTPQRRISGANADSGEESTLHPAIQMEIVKTGPPNYTANFGRTRLAWRRPPGRAAGPCGRTGPPRAARSSALAHPALADDLRSS